MVHSLLFLATTFISVKNLLYYRRNGSLPNTTTTHAAQPLPNHDEDDQAKYAFSSNPHDQFDEDEEAGHGAGGSTNYEVLHPATDDHDGAGGHHPWASQQSNLSTSHLPRYDDPDRIDTSYHGTTTTSSAPQLPPHRDPFRDRSPSPYRMHNPPPAELGEEDTGYHGGDGRGRYDPNLRREAGDPFRDDLAVRNEHGGGGRVDFPEADYHR